MQFALPALLQLQYPMVHIQVIESIYIILAFYALHNFIILHYDKHITAI